MNETLINKDFLSRIKKEIEHPDLVNIRELLSDLEIYFSTKPTKFTMSKCCCDNKNCACS